MSVESELFLDTNQPGDGCVLEQLHLKLGRWNFPREETVDGFAEMFAANAEDFGKL